MDNIVTKILDELLQNEDTFEKVKLMCQDTDTEAIKDVAISVVANFGSSSTELQEENFLKFFKMLPPDTVVSIWKDMNKNSNLRRLITEKWRHDAEFDRVIERAFIDPITKKVEE